MRSAIPRFTVYTGRLLLSLMFVAVASACFAQAGSAPGQGTTRSIPMHYNPLKIPAPVVYFIIDHSDPLPFMLDTGASNGISLVEATRRQLKLPIASYLSPNIGRYDRTTMESVTLCGSSRADDIAYNSPTAGPVHARIVDGIVGKVLADEHIAGIVGLFTLKSLGVLRLDFAKQVLTVGLNEDLKETLKNAAALSATLDTDSNLHVQIPFVSGQTEDMLVDTGSTETILANAPALKGLYLGPSVAVHIESTQAGARMLLEQVQIDTFTEKNVVMNLVNRKPSLLGMNLLARFRLTFDLPNSRLYLERSEDYNDRVRNMAPSTVTLAKRQDKIRVAKVEAASAAALAGLKPNDEIVSVEGQAPPAGSLFATQHMVDGYEGTRATLEVRRDGKALSLTYLRETLASAAGQFAPTSK